MPSSMCWPSGANSHFAVDGIRWLIKASDWAARANSLRRFTQGPRLVVPVTSGEVVTMRAESSLSPLASWSRILPNAAWVEISRSSGAGTAGTGMRASP